MENFQLLFADKLQTNETLLFILLNQTIGSIKISLDINLISNIK